MCTNITLKILLPKETRTKYLQGKEIWCLRLVHNEHKQNQKSKHPRSFKTHVPARKRSAQQETAGKRPPRHHRPLTLAGSPLPSLCTAVLASSGSALVLIWKAKDKWHIFFSKSMLWKMVFLQLLALSSQFLIGLQFPGSPSCQDLPSTGLTHSPGRGAGWLRHTRPGSPTAFYPQGTLE